MLFSTAVLVIPLHIGMNRLIMMVGVCAGEFRPIGIPNLATALLSIPVTPAFGRIYPSMCVAGRVDIAATGRFWT